MKPCNIIQRSGNTGMGDGALNANTTGSGNTATGYSSLDANTTGTNNTAMDTMR